MWSSFFLPFHRHKLAIVLRGSGLSPHDFLPHYIYGHKILAATTLLHDLPDHGIKILIQFNSLPALLYGSLDLI